MVWVCITLRLSFSHSRTYVNGGFLPARRQAGVALHKMSLVVFIHTTRSILLGRLLPRLSYGLLRQSFSVGAQDKSNSIRFRKSPYFFMERCHDTA